MAKDIPYDQKYYDPEIECMPRPELEALQLERLKDMVAYAYDNTVYYKRAFDEAGVKPGDIESLDDIAKFPFCDKKTERETQHVGSFFGEMCSVPEEEVIFMATSSGSTGVPTVSPFTQEDVVKMARQINSGSLPFALTVDSYSTISPSLGENSLSAMVLAGVIAFALIMVLMTALYRLPGFLACIALAGQVAATLAFVSGYFPVFESFTLTLPGIAGIILAIGMGVDANVITAERIKEELRSGKSLDGALKSGFARGLTPFMNDVQNRIDTVGDNNGI